MENKRVTDPTPHPTLTPLGQPTCHPPLRGAADRLECCDETRSKHQLNFGDIFDLLERRLSGVGASGSGHTGR